MAKRPKTIWAVFYGFGFDGIKGPMKLVWQAAHKSWVSEEDYYVVYKLGLDGINWMTSFSSESKDEVKTFVKGYRACMRSIRSKLEWLVPEEK